MVSAEEKNAMTRTLQWAAIVVAATGLGMAPAAWPAGLFAPGGGTDAKAPIEIVSDRMVANTAEKWADFLGAVVATQGKFSMTADALRIHYEGDLANAPKGGSAQERIQKIVATGRVHIVSDQYTADADRAEYVPSADLLTLSGKPSRVVSGKNTLTGAKIVLNRSEGKALVEGGDAERVKAVFFQEEKGGGQRTEGPKP
jgi:lipopolysaccharide export system protein LptA